MTPQPMLVGEAEVEAQSLIRGTALTMPVGAGVRHQHPREGTRLADFGPPWQLVHSMHRLPPSSPALRPIGRPAAPRGRATDSMPALPRLLVQSGVPSSAGRCSVGGGPPGEQRSRWCRRDEKARRQPGKVVGPEVRRYLALQGRGGSPLVRCVAARPLRTAGFPLETETRHGASMRISGTTRKPLVGGR